MCELLVRNPHTCDKLVPNYHRCEELVLFIAVDVSDKTVKNWNRMQNAVELRVFYRCEKYACYIKFDFVRFLHKV